MQQVKIIRSFRCAPSEICSMSSRVGTPSCSYKGISLTYQVYNERKSYLFQQKEGTT